MVVAAKAGADSAASERATAETVAMRRVLNMEIPLWRTLTSLADAAGRPSGNKLRGHP